MYSVVAIRFRFLHVQPLECERQPINTTLFLYSSPLCHADVDPARPTDKNAPARQARSPGAAADCNLLRIRVPPPRPRPVHTNSSDARVIKDFKGCIRAVSRLARPCHGRHKWVPGRDDRPDKSAMSTGGVGGWRSPERLRLCAQDHPSDFDAGDGKRRPSQDHYHVESATNGPVRGRAQVQ